MVRLKQGTRGVDNHRQTGDGEFGVDEHVSRLGIFYKVWTRVPETLCGHDFPRGVLLWTNSSTFLKGLIKFQFEYHGFG